MKRLITLIALAISTNILAFESGSTGVDGELNITENTELQLSPSGIFNFTNVTIAAGTTLTFAKNANNTPVTILASGDVTIDGVINVRGTNPTFVGGMPGIGGPGGFNGGQGGFPFSTGFNGSTKGLGPGGGGAVPSGVDNAGGQGGSFQTGPGTVYGNARLLPLVGGSGGSGSTGTSFGTGFGTGGAGGGGAILIAATGTVTVNGSIGANGGNAGTGTTTASGGGGSGGAIRIVSTTLEGNGTISAIAGFPGAGLGRIRLEAENMLRTSTTNPAFIFSSPGPIFLSTLPSIKIATIGGISVPVNPTGDNDVQLPGVTTNPVTVTFETINVPLGTSINLKALSRGIVINTNSNGVSGSLTSGAASVDINLPNGKSILEATATFEITTTTFLGKDFSNYAQGEQVKEVKVTVNTHGKSETTFITVSGKEFSWPSNSVALN